MTAVTHSAAESDRPAERGVLSDLGTLLALWPHIIILPPEFCLSPLRPTHLVLPCLNSTRFAPDSPQQRRHTQPAPLFLLYHYLPTHNNMDDGKSEILQNFCAITGDLISVACQKKALHACAQAVSLLNDLTNTSKVHASPARTHTIHTLLRFRHFCTCAGVDDMGVAMNVLEATNWALEDAINLQFATGGDQGGGGAGAAGGAGGADALPPLDEENVRAPMPVMRDRLYGDARMGMHGVPARAGVAR